MPAQKPITREYRIYLAIWRKALHSNEPILMKCSTRNMAIAMRQGMYRAIRPFRNGELIDEELRTAAEKFVVSFKDQINLEIRARTTLDAIEGMFDELGIDENDLLLGDERRANESLSKFLEQPSEQKRNTPFYTRDE